MQKTIELKILDDRLLGWGLPAYAKPGDGGMDLRASIGKPFYLEPGETQLVPTGIAIHINNENLIGLLFPRSGLASKHGIGLANSVGVIDCHYQGEIKAALHRSSRSKNDPHWIQPGDKIAQLVLIKKETIQWSVVEEFSKITERGEMGFGSTGV